MYIARPPAIRRAGESPRFTQTRYGPQRRAGKKLLMHGRGGFRLPRRSGKLERWFGLGEAFREMSRRAIKKTRIE